MAVIKRYNLRGLATKIDDLYKNPDYATDCRNVVKDCSGRIIGRDGLVSSDPVLASTDMYYSPDKKEHISFNGGGAKRSTDGVTFTDIPKYFTGDLNDSIKSFSENSGYVFFSDTEAVDEIMKYDGYGIYQAGLPKVTGGALSLRSTSGSLLSGEFEFKACFVYNGPDGEKYYGPLSYIGKITVPVDNWVRLDFDKIGEKYSNKQSAWFMSFSSGSTIPWTATAKEHNYVSGDYIICKTSSGDVIPCRVASVTVDSVTIDAQSEQVSVSTNGSYNNYSIAIFAKKTSETNYYLTREDGIQTDGNLISVATRYNWFALAASSKTWDQCKDTIFFSIDETINPDDTRAPPIKSKYITNIGDIIFSLNIVEENQGVPGVSLAKSALKYSLAFSVIGAGCASETYNYSNTLTIGSSDEGEITGASPCNSHLIVFKERATYLVPIGSDGTVGRLVRLSSTVGCASNKAIGTYDEYSVWLSDRGVYSQSGSGALKELSDPIENLFTDNVFGLDFSTARIARDRFNELVLFYVKKSTGLSDIIFVYSYKFDEWYLYDGIDADSGFYHDGTSVFASTGTSLNKLSPASKNDLGLAIDKYYKSGWEANGEHSVEKKFVNILCYSIQYTNKTYNDWTLDVSAQNDWDESIVYDCGSESFSSTARRKFYNLDKTAGYSRRLTFRNNVLNQGFYLSGYDIEFMQPQQRIRD